MCWVIGDDRWSVLQSFFLEVECDELFGRLALVVSLAGGLTLPVNFFLFSFVVLRILLYLWDGGGGRM